VPDKRLKNFSGTFFDQKVPGINGVPHGVRK
jgi:hypothetical protein